MTAGRTLTLALGLVLGGVGTLGAMSGNTTAMIVLFAGLILLALGIERD